MGCERVQNRFRDNDWMQFLPGKIDLRKKLNLKTELFPKTNEIV